MAISVQIPTASNNTLVEANIPLPAAGPSLCSVTFSLKAFVKDNPSQGKWSSHPPGPQVFSKMYPLFERMINTLSGKENEGAQDSLWGLQLYETCGVDHFQKHSALPGLAQIKDRRMCISSKF